MSVSCGEREVSPGQIGSSRIYRSWPERCEGRDGLLLGRKSYCEILGALQSFLVARSPSVVGRGPGGSCLQWLAAGEASPVLRHRCKS